MTGPLSTGHPLLGDDSLPTDDIEAYLAEHGEIVSAFVHQDSGCRSWCVVIDGERWFVKHARTPAAVESLRRAVALHAAVRHPAIVPLRTARPTAAALALVYPFVDGEPLYGLGDRTGAAARRDPAGPHARFRGLPVGEVLDAVDAVIDAHVAVTAAGFVAVDLYDGCFLYDFERKRIHLIDLDEYRPGPFRVEGERLPGSTRFMAPEEWQQGAVIDERTTVFNLGRTALVLLDEGDDEGRWRAGRELLRVALQAGDPDPGRRLPSVAELAAAWRTARADDGDGA